MSVPDRAAILEKLAGGDRRSIGRVAEVVRDVLAKPELLADLVDGLTNPDPLIRMRCADALEKATAGAPDHLRPFKDRLLDLLAEAQQQEVRWHLAQLLPRLELDSNERQWAVRHLLGFLEDRSRIVRTFAMQALADLAMQDAALRQQVIAVLDACVRDGSPAMRSRGRRLLARLQQTASA